MIGLIKRPGLSTGTLKSNSKVWFDAATLFAFNANTLPG
jgi:hypothetical protein